MLVLIICSALIFKNPESAVITFFYSIVCNLVDYLRYMFEGFHSPNTFHLDPQTKRFAQ